MLNCGFEKTFDDASAARAGWLVRLTSTGAMVAETIDGDKLDRFGAVTMGRMVPI
jgi:hypothetical protein